MTSLLPLVTLLAGAGLAACGGTTACRADAGPYGPDALPSGACAGGESCAYLIREPCATGQGPVDTWTCDCTRGSWSCAITAHGMALCMPADGGPD